MKIIDKTPLVDEKGELGPMQRIQGMLKYGFSWPNELEAQKAIVTFFDRQLEKGYTLIRNMPLGASGITVPIILLGPTGIYVIHVTYLRGRYEAKGNTWNEESGNGYKPAPINLIQRTARMANAVKVFIERQGVKLPVEIEPILIAGNPGLHIESVRPAIKVMMIDGIKSFTAGLMTGRPVMSIDAVHDFTDRIINPRPPKKETPAPPAPAAAAPDASAPWEQLTQPPPQMSRAQTIFNASAEAKPFDPADLDFAMLDEEPAVKVPPASIRETSPAQPLPRRAPPGKRILGMTLPQLIFVVALALAFLCLLVTFAVLYFAGPSLLQFLGLSL
ncbi:MAG TPA: nuclease-related domain-containing protein [Anaerolineales bacterium]|nr:nuclease-related domain-containing protein [Anaerolineales bacterium]